uniref:Uncharacterized protein n=1 Tax=Triticum urartu TaxID=4572 RepID=A0A8R7PYX6_TRIUA
KFDRGRRLVPDEYVVLDGGVAGLEVQGVRPGLRVPAGPPENACTTDDSDLTDLVEHSVATHNDDAAAVVLSGREDEVHVHEQRDLVLAGGDVGALGAAHEPGRVEAGALGERVVDDTHEAEGCLGGVSRGRARYPHRRRVRSAQHVMPIHLEVRLLLRRRGLRLHGGQGEEDEEGRGRGHG